jgi:hypothetical protein
MPPYVAEAFYLRGALAASGMFPQYVTRDLRSSFKDYETAARTGYDAGWFKIGRDYEGVQDFRRATDVFERGVRLGEKNCLYVSSFRTVSMARARCDVELLAEDGHGTLARSPGASEEP